jgi:hypothetical protein
MFGADLGWEYPFFFVAIAVAIVVIWALLRMVNPKQVPPSWTCKLCNAPFKGAREEKYRYCPFCGTVRRRRLGSPEELDEEFPLDEDTV